MLLIREPFLDTLYKWWHFQATSNCLEVFVSLESASALKRLANTDWSSYFSSCNTSSPLHKCHETEINRLKQPSPNITGQKHRQSGIQLTVWCLCRKWKSWNPDANMQCKLSEGWQVLRSNLLDINNVREYIYGPSAVLITLAYPLYTEAGC